MNKEPKDVISKIPIEAEEKTQTSISPAERMAIRALNRVSMKHAADAVEITKECRTRDKP